MSKNTRTVATAHARLDAIEGDLTEIKTMLAALVQGNAPAKTVRKAPARKAPAKKAAPKPTKGTQTRETLSRKEWNRTLTAKAKLAGGDTYKRVLGAWEACSGHRDAGMTPDAVLALFA